MKVSISRALGIIFTGGLSIYLFKKFQSIYNEMVAIEKIAETATNNEHVAKTLPLKNNAEHTNGYVKKSIKFELKNGISKAKVECDEDQLSSIDEDELSSTDLINEDTNSIKNEDIQNEFIVKEQLASFGNTNFLENTFANENCGLHQVITVQVPFDTGMQDDDLPAISPSSIEELQGHNISQFEGQGQSDVSSICSSVSPVSDLTLLSLKFEETNQILAAELTSNAQNLQLKEQNVEPVEVVCQSSNNIDSTTKAFRVDAEEFHPKVACALPSEIPTASDEDQMPKQDVADNADLSQFLLPKNKQPNDEDFLQLYSENIVYCVINVPNEFVGKLLGKKGKFVQKIKNGTGIAVTIDKIVTNGHKSCYLQGQDSNVCQSLDMIEKLFPSDSFPEMSTILSDAEIINIPPQNKVTVGFQNPAYDAIDQLVPIQVTGISTVNCLYVQILNHPLYSQLAAMQESIQAIYEQYQTPNIPFPCAVGSLCVGNIASEWHRCEVVECKTSTVMVFLGDTGCTVEVEPSLLKLALKCLIDIPFFAAQVLLNSIQVPPDESQIAKGNEWLGQAASQYLTYANLVGRDLNETPIIQLLSLREENKLHLLNSELVTMGFAHCNVTNTIPATT